MTDMPSSAIAWHHLDSPVGTDSEADRETPLRCLAMAIDLTRDDGPNQRAPSVFVVARVLSQFAFAGTMPNLRLTTNHLLARFVDPEASARDQGS